MAAAPRAFRGVLRLMMILLVLHSAIFVGLDR
jgi:hypothetical protein